MSVGIGTSAPLDVLQVVGDIRVGNSDSNGCLKNFMGGAITGNCSSDLRLKTNVQPFAPVLGRLVQLQPVSFYWKVAEYPEYHFGPGRNAGLVAQEVEKLFPELVGEDWRGYKTMNYSQLPMLLLQAIRELNAEAHALQEQLEGQRAAIVALQGKLPARKQRPAP